MKTLIPLSAALLMAAAPAAMAQDHGHGNGNGHSQGAGQAHGAGHADHKAERQAPPGHAGHTARHEDDRVRTVRTVVHAPEVRPQADHRAKGHDDRRLDGRDVQRELARRVGADPRDVRVVNDYRRDWNRSVIDGCPPGLARRDNGCLPPGLARKVERAERDRYAYLWSAPRNDDYIYRYDEGYLYRMSPQGSLLGYLPVLGGVLSQGNAWPAQYAYQPVPAYFSDYYNLNDRYNYRYADGAVYGLDPQTQAISQVAALLTGQQWNVGQPMPAGYDVYNVPYAYRGQYADTADSLYRYNDGYVYQVDPTTQVVQAVIQLLT